MDTKIIKALCALWLTAFFSLLYPEYVLSGDIYEYIPVSGSLEEKQEQKLPAADGNSVWNNDSLEKKEEWETVVGKNHTFQKKEEMEISGWKDIMETDASEIRISSEFLKLLENI